MGKILGRFLQKRILVVILASLAVLGGATGVMAATPPGQNLIQTLSTSTTTTTQHGKQGKGEDKQNMADEKKEHSNDKSGKQAQGNPCPGLPKVQDLTAKFGLSAQNDVLQTLCSLHQGMFKGTNSTGMTVSSNKIFGYGEIDDLLQFAQFLASHDKAHPGNMLTNANLQRYLADALQKCGTLPLMVCLKNNLPDSHPGNGNGKGKNGNDHGKKGDQ